MSERKSARRPIEEAFWRLHTRYPDRSVLSLRKRMCLAYLEFKTRRSRTYRMAWVYLAVDFRKAEGRLGMKRTKLEKLARKNFRFRRKQIKFAPSRQAAREFALGQVERGEGIHTPDIGEPARQAMLKKWQEWKAIGYSPVAKDWVITAKDGTEFRVRSLASWCRENGVHRRNLHATAAGKRNWAAGYRCRKYDEVLDAHVPWEHEVR